MKSNMESNSTFGVVSKACRYNSGRHFLDSGGSNGRHWQKPPLDVDTPVATFDACIEHGIWGGRIETAHFISEQCEVHELNSGFDAWANREENSELSWFEAGEKYMEDRGYKQLARDNTYNCESDLTQCYIWEVWVPEGEDCSDWIYADDSVLVCYFHTGADVRGGYSYPVFLEAQGEYTAPLDLVAEYHIDEARKDGSVDDEAACDLSEEWQAGYSSYPFGQVEQDVERWFMFTLSADKTSVCAKLKTGEIVKIYVEASCHY